MTALVTGASSGIGLQYATVLARDYHCDLFLVSNQEQELQEVAHTLHQAYQVKTTSYCMDLADINAAETLYHFAQENNLEIDVLINNAGILIFKPIIETEMPKVQTLLMLHMVTLTKLCKLFGDDMCKRGKGYILNMSSMTAWMTMPGIQCYNASKAYVLNFSKALWYEFKPNGVHVLAVTPGTINTPLFNLPERLRKLLVATGIAMQPEKLVKRALRKLFRSWTKRTMPGAINYIIVPIISHLPDWFVFTVMKRLPLFKPCMQRQYI